jgi:beta-glucanase (GH16 family)
MQSSYAAFFITKVSAVLISLAASTASAQLLWSEEFNEGPVPDESVWSYDLGASGWGNNELQEYTKDTNNVRVEDGHLVISVLKGTDGQGRLAFTSGRIRTQDKFTFKYGTIEARIKIPDLENGLWPAFWTLGNSFGSIGWPASGELDIMEMGIYQAIVNGTVNRHVGSAAHWEFNGGHSMYSGSYTTSEPLDDNFHIFRMDWTPASVSTFIDGKAIWTMAISESSCAQCTELHEPHFIILNIAVGGDYPQISNPADISAPIPADMLVDYVRVYDNGFTELAGSAITNTVAPTSPRHSGSWYSSDQDGHGFAVEFGEDPGGNPLAVVYWYIYDDLGNPIFLVGSGSPDGNMVDINFKSPLGMKFGEFDSTTVVREPGGTGHFMFSDENNGTFSYTPSEFTITNWGHSAIESLPIEKLFAIPFKAPTGTAKP